MISLVLKNMNQPILFTAKWARQVVCPPSGGCDIIANNDNTFGVPFNKIGGGVFATELNDIK